MLFCGINTCFATSCSVHLGRCGNRPDSHASHSASLYNQLRTVPAYGLNTKPTKLSLVRFHTSVSRLSSKPAQAPIRTCSWGSFFSQIDSRRSGIFDVDISPSPSRQQGQLTDPAVLCLLEDTPLGTPLYSGGLIFALTDSLKYPAKRSLAAVGQLAISDLLEFRSFCGLLIK